MKTISSVFVCLFPIFMGLSVVGCGSTPSKPVDDSARETVSQPQKVGRIHSGTGSRTSDSRLNEIEETIDLNGLARSLAFPSDVERYGYFEKAFDTCSAGFGFSSTQNCRRLLMAVVQFQIVCRNSEGTISTILSDEDLRPLSGRMLNWSLAGKTGSVKLDPDGRGQIQVLSANSVKRERLKIASANDFLYIRAEESRRLVTPINWCND